MLSNLVLYAQSSLSYPDSLVQESNSMSPTTELDQLAALRGRIVELEQVIQRQRQRLQMTDTRFRELADSAPFLIWISGADGMCTYVNRAWLDLRGRRLDEELGNGWTEGLHPEDRDHCLDTYLRSLSTREPFRIQYRVLRASGDYCWLENTGVPLCDEDGAFAGFMGAAQDISDRKRGMFVPDEEAARLVFALTERERQVLVLIAGGKSTKETAAQLGISYKTADSHRSRILEKLGVHETASMVRYAIRAGLIEA
jgi:PAS domain S-box-containing protein